MSIIRVVLLLGCAFWGVIAVFNKNYSEATFWLLSMHVITSH